MKYIAISYIARKYNLYYYVETYLGAAHQLVTMSLLMYGSEEAVSVVAQARNNVLL